MTIIMDIDDLEKECHSPLLLGIKIAAKAMRGDIKIRRGI